LTEDYLRDFKRRFVNLHTPLFLRQSGFVTVVFL